MKSNQHGQLIVNQSAKHADSFQRRAWRAIKRDLKAHPIKWSVRGAVWLYVTGLLIHQQLTLGRVSPVLLICFCVFAAVTLMRIWLLASDKGQQVEDWAVTQKEHETAQQLSEDKPEDLEKLLNYHMKYGNIQAADRISQRLLAVTESTPITSEAQPQAAPAPLATPSGLPNWLDGQMPDEGKVIKVKRQPVAQEPAQEEQQSGEKKLPDWMG